VAIPYATADDLANWGEAPVPDNVDQLLRSATYIVAAAINENPYTVTADQPRKDATTAQAAAWIASGVTPAASGLSDDPPVKAKRIGTASVDFDTSLSASVTAFEKRVALAEKLSPEAREILYVTGLLSVDLPVWNIPLDTTTYPPSSPGGLPSTWPLDVGYGGY
jgi:hypothetical protein